jgi:hypothetical protein
MIALLLACFAIAATTADASSVKKRNLGELIALGEDIVFGTVVSVTDGFDRNNVPYTEVTVEISETAKGDKAGTYTFRQFGLIAPRDMGNGRVNLNVTPDGWPTYSQGEEVALFLYKPAKWTGLRTTVGLFQGKFTVDENGALTNIIDNEGLFENMRIDKSMLDGKEREMLEMKRGRIPVDIFKSFVRKSVQQKWFAEEGE